MMAPSGHAACVTAVAWHGSTAGAAGQPAIAREELRGSANPR